MGFMPNSLIRRDTRIFHRRLWYACKYSCLMLRGIYGNNSGIYGNSSSASMETVVVSMKTQLASTETVVVSMATLLVSRETVVVSVETLSVSIETVLELGYLSIITAITNILVRFSIKTVKILLVRLINYRNVIKVDKQPVYM